MDERLKYSTDKVALVRAARSAGMSDDQVLLAICRGETAAERRRIIREWAPALGFTEIEALALAQRLGITKR